MALFGLLRSSESHEDESIQVSEEEPRTRFTTINKGTVERDGEVTSADPDLLNLVYSGWTYREARNKADEQLKLVNLGLLNSVGVGASVVVEGICKATLSERQTVEVKDPDKLKHILGEQRFNDLVNTTTRYTCGDKLIEISGDADHPLAEQIRGCLIFKASQSVTYHPIKG